MGRKRDTKASQKEESCVLKNDEKVTCFKVNLVHPLTKICKGNKLEKKIRVRCLFVTQTWMSIGKMWVKRQ